MKTKTFLYIALYLLAAVLANLSVAYFGPTSVIFNAFLFIGLDLTSRDNLHEAWGGVYLWPKMFALIAVGSLISWVLNSGAGRIAFASLLAFCLSGVVDAIVYQFLHKQKWMIKVNGSNVFSALADSLIFPTIAFGSFMPLIVLGQFAAKVAGGFVWAAILGARRKAALIVQTE
jgi:queuosine precursor transporter